MNLTAPIAMAPPKTMPANWRLPCPSEKANTMPQTTTATAISAVAIGPVNAVFRFCAEEVQGSPCARAPPADTLIAANSLKRRFFCDFMILPMQRHTYSAALLAVETEVLTPPHHKDATRPPYLEER